MNFLNQLAITFGYGLFVLFCVLLIVSMINESINLGLYDYHSNDHSMYFNEFWD